ncbi:N-acetylmuramoyl-L-alanine amidase [Saccharothrix australiensis]|uniref:N-acetylmuramoyl-L-alanine amidase n=1 Tax=Saccharothrix australiensis TaxID=2072 RepID=A0A495VNJ3_9PSEU|nr:N-acetylmuramoyl-L-alanine amidase [Saccharothrix australiensis]RKT49368.1 N-acetylmuramoyl-L-alanine amidase [Saccharothrix australiensis]
MAPYSSDRPAPPFFIVVHTGEGILDRFDMAAYLDDNSEASAHAAGDAGGVVGPLVPYARAAWTAGETANSYGLHIELCAFAAMSREQWLSRDDVDVWVPWIRNGDGSRGAWRRVRSPLSMLRHAAEWARDRCREFDITVRKITAADLRRDVDGICGHADTSAAWGETDHTDPGPGFPWPEFIALVQGDDVKEDDVPLATEIVWRGERGWGKASDALTSAEAQATEAARHGAATRQVLTAMAAQVAAIADRRDVTPDELERITHAAVRAAQQEQTAELLAALDGRLPDLLDEAVLAEELARRGVGGASVEQVREAVREVLRRGVEGGVSA